MAYVEGTNRPVLWIPSIGGGPALWVYTHATDAHTAIDESGYFSDGAKFGMKAGDVMVVIDTDTATCTIHMVASATTINPATLA